MIFDVDGVLVDSHGAYRQVWQRWALLHTSDAEVEYARLIAGALPVPGVLVDGHAVSRGRPDPEGFLLAADLFDRVGPGRLPR
ncbi:hypothetical protein NUM3379_22070 [Kineococcus sp. NUM-3379]